MNTINYWGEEMEIWYQFLSWFPFEWAEPGRMLFFKNALLAMMIMAPLFGLLSTMIVNNKMAFFSESLGHGAFTGIVIGNLAGLFDPLLSAVLFAVVFSVLVSVVRVYARMSPDTVIGVFSSLSVALGIFLATLGGGNFNRLNSLLIGDLMSIRPWEIGLLFVVLLLVFGYFVQGFNRMLILSVNSAIARSRGIHPLRTEMLFAAVVAVVVTLSINWVGMLLINSMLILPAAIARNLSSNVARYTWISVLVSLVCGIGGMLGSYYVGNAAAAFIVLLLGIVFALSFLLANRMD